MPYSLKAAVEIVLAEETNLPLRQSRELADRIAALMAADGPVVAWVIESPDRLPWLTHTKGVAKVEEKFGSIVTPFHSRVPL